MEWDSRLLTEELGGDDVIVRRQVLQGPSGRVEHRVPLHVHTLTLPQHLPHTDHGKQLCESPMADTEDRKGTVAIA